MVGGMGWGVVFFRMVVRVERFCGGVRVGMFGGKGIGGMIILGGVWGVLRWRGVILGRKVENWVGF